MSHITLVVASRFRSSSERASLLLENLNFDSLFLSFPEELSESLNLYSMREMTEEEFWCDYTALTGLSAPFANALRYKLGPILNKLPLIRRKHDFTIYCFEDLKNHVQLKRFTERQLLLEFKSRATGKVYTDEWRTLIREQLEAGKILEEKIVETIQEKLSHKNSLIIYAGFVKTLKKKFCSKYNVKVVCLENYWKPPLDVLKTLFELKGVDTIPDDIVNLCIKQHLKYLDYVLLHDDADTAHSIWFEESKPHKAFPKCGKNKFSYNLSRNGEAKK